LLEKKTGITTELVRVKGMNRLKETEERNQNWLEQGKVKRMKRLKNGRVESEFVREEDRHNDNEKVR
jgi:hypothetical protein